MLDAVESAGARARARPRRRARALPARDRAGQAHPARAGARSRARSTSTPNCVPRSRGSRTASSRRSRAPRRSPTGAFDSDAVGPAGCALLTPPEVAALRARAGRGPRAPTESLPNAARGTTIGLSGGEEEADMGLIAELLHKRTPVVHIVSPQQPVIDAVALMAARRVGAVPGGRGGPPGRDLQRARPACAAWSRWAAPAEKTQLGEVMTAGPGHRRPGRRARLRDAARWSRSAAATCRSCSTARWSTCSRSATCCSASSRSAPKPWSRCAATSAAATRSQARSQRALIGLAIVSASMRVALAQINPTIGDFAGNLRAIRAAAARARPSAPRSWSCPSSRCAAIRRWTCSSATASCATSCASSTSSRPRRAASRSCSARCCPRRRARRKRLVERGGAAATGGEIAHVQAKTLLPTYDVFDESRYFQPAQRAARVEFRGRRRRASRSARTCGAASSGARAGLPGRSGRGARGARRRGRSGPLGLAVARRQEALREAMLRDAARQHRVPIVFVNQVGGNDELIFDGTSFAVDARRARGRARCRASPRTSRWSTRSRAGRPEAPPLESRPGAARARARARHPRLLGQAGPAAGAVIGLSGGIDSAVTAHLAARALGPENVAGLADAGAVLVRAQHQRRARARAQPRHRGAHGAHRLDLQGLPRAVPQPVRPARELRAHAGEHPGAHPRRAADGGLERRGPASCSRPATRASSRWATPRCTATRSAGSRCSATSTSATSTRSRATPTATASASRAARSRSRPRPSSRRASSTATTCRRTRCSTRCCTRRSSSACPADEIEPPPGATRETVAWILRAIDRNEYKRRQAPLVLRVSQKAFGSGRRIPIVHRSGWGV